MSSIGTLYLIPTPLNDDFQISPESKTLLADALKVDSSIFLVEELKPARRRWISWGLDRSGIERFISYSEHNQITDAMKIIRELKSGKNVYLLSDGGLPAFCDPGQYLVSLCHDHNIIVTSGSFCNSPILALTLSGFQCQPFYFVGFLPLKDQRSVAINELAKKSETLIIMDTPYRLNRLLSELAKVSPLKNRRAFLAMDLTMPSEQYSRDSIINLSKTTWGKREFIVVIDAIL